ncbi:hypothetical protein VOLCADRAFT_87348 [Volvox carteri f. nagariensis]|uniref:Uncharacterized protein n=1 Tax=Volvox carteri f. nagariensis TaxID=3068 RepID=D8TL41_VOLCA|nr:uncharacterized protein VOLCADRAFT_87348 [Volvox carteri f. nagariensis]EFJ51673.1 hypothetical protein VOLCADRAFT_87348 [Volvox carteri f. nagariensis]|eukprot:XP_002947083.1 hypothetical protein VOLCADRAFT_87348 [Volvox carteri f. nagariensis]
MRVSQLVLLQHSCGLPHVSEPGPPTAEDDDLSRAARLITQGAFLDAVRTVPAIKALLDCSSETEAVHDVESYYALVRRRAAAAVEEAISAQRAGDVRTGSETASDAAVAPEPNLDSNVGGVDLRLEAVLVAGIACLHIFGQNNLTGPLYEGPPPSPLHWFASAAVARHAAEPPPRPPPAVTAAAIAAAVGGGSAGGGTAAAGKAEETHTCTTTPPSGSGTSQPADGLAGLGIDSLSRGDRWAQEQLQLDGEDLVGRCPAIQWLLLARVLLLDSLNTHSTHTLDKATAAAEGEGEEMEAAEGKQEQGGPGGGPASGGSGAPGVCWSEWVWCWPWWALRCVMSQQHVLEGRSHSLLSEASQLIAALVSPECPWTHHHPASDPRPSRPTGRELAALGGVLHLEMALCQYLYGYVDAGRQYLVRAGQMLGLEPQLTGAMGKRTVHQIDPKGYGGAAGAQLVVVTSESLRAAPPADSTDEPVELLGRAICSKRWRCWRRYSPPEQALLLAWATAVKKGSSADELQGWQMAPWVEAVLGQPRGVFMTLAAAKLNKTRHERTRGRTKERALLQMDQLTEAVTGLPPPPPPAAAAEVAAADGSTRELEEPESSSSSAPAASGGSAATASAAVDATAASAGAVSEAAAAVSGRRAVLSWAVWFPLQVGVIRAGGVTCLAGWCWPLGFCVKLKREAAEHYVSMGLVGAAIQVFESVELWDSAITCYRLIGKKALAEELIKRRLGTTPDDPRLWCALGDLHLDDRYYEEAWRRSGHRHTRSQRSLARSAMGRKWAWFSAGFCYLKLNKHRQALRVGGWGGRKGGEAVSSFSSASQLKLRLEARACILVLYCTLLTTLLPFCFACALAATSAAWPGRRQTFFQLHAFTRVTQQEPDNGEAWNNIAALWMHVGGYKPAFAALSESVRHKRDSWQTWENYARAALASGHYQQAVRGLQTALKLSSGHRLFVDVASGLLDVLEGRPPPRDGGTSMAAAAAAAAEGLRGVAAEAGEDEAALGVPLLPLLADIPLNHPDQQLQAGKGGGGEAEAEAAVAAANPTAAPRTTTTSSSNPPAADVLLSGREREVVVGGLGALLREAVNSPAASAALWGCLARYWALRGEVDSAKEARIKQVRGLASGAYKSDAARFTEYGEASDALCRCYLDCYKHGKPGALGTPGATVGVCRFVMFIRRLPRVAHDDAPPSPFSPGGLKDLAAGRMHLRGLLRATAENFGDHPITAKLQALLDEITQLEDEAVATSRAAATARS